MATITEVSASREADISVESGGRTLRYLIGEASTDLEAEAILAATMPALYRGLFFQGYSVRPLGAGVWEAEAQYTTRQPKEAGRDTFNFDTAATTTKIRQSLKTVGEFVEQPALGDPPDVFDFKRSIGVGPDGKVEGVEIPIPRFSFTLTRVLAAMTQYYAEILEAYVGRVNRTGFFIFIQGVRYVFQPHELRYMGTTGGKKGIDDWEVTLRFEVSRTVNALSIGDIDNIKKRGWDYLWVKYREVATTNADGEVIGIISKPRQVNVEEVHDEAPLEELFA